MKPLRWHPNAQAQQALNPRTFACRCGAGRRCHRDRRGRRQVSTWFAAVPCLQRPRR